MKAMLLAVAYSANIGGIGTLIGTPVNLILVDQLQTGFPQPDGAEVQAGSEINFLTWMMFAVPVSIGWFESFRPKWYLRRTGFRMSYISRKFWGGCIFAKLS